MKLIARINRTPELERIKQLFEGNMPEDKDILFILPESEVDLLASVNENNNFNLLLGTSVFHSLPSESASIYVMSQVEFYSTSNSSDVYLKKHISKYGFLFSDYSNLRLLKTAYINLSMLLKEFSTVKQVVLKWEDKKRKRKRKHEQKIKNWEAECRNILAQNRVDKEVAKESGVVLAEISLPEKPKQKKDKGEKPLDEINLLKRLTLQFNQIKQNHSKEYELITNYDILKIKNTSFFFFRKFNKCKVYSLLEVYNNFFSQHHSEFIESIEQSEFIQEFNNMDHQATQKNYSNGRINLSFNQPLIDVFFKLADSSSTNDEFELIDMEQGRISESSVLSDLAPLGPSQSASVLADGDNDSSFEIQLHNQTCLVKSAPVAINQQRVIFVNGTRTEEIITSQASVLSIYNEDTRELEIFRD